MVDGDVELGVHLVELEAPLRAEEEGRVGQVGVPGQPGEGGRLHVDVLAEVVPHVGHGDAAQDQEDGQVDHPPQVAGVLHFFLPCTPTNRSTKELGGAINMRERQTFTMYEDE